MKVALYIEDGLEQIVLTPETETEGGIVKKMHDDTRELSIKSGSFYACSGGWTRHKKQYHNIYGNEQDDESTIIVLRRRATP